MINMPRPSSGRTRNLRLIVSDEELNMAHTLAENTGVTMSDIIRMLIREAYARQQAPGAKKGRK
jgi:hypothetical protein